MFLKGKVNNTKTNNYNLYMKQIVELFLVTLKSMNKIYIQCTVNDEYVRET